MVGRKERDAKEKEEKGEVKEGGWKDGSKDINPFGFNILPKFPL